MSKKGGAGGGGGGGGPFHAGNGFLLYLGEPTSPYAYVACLNLV